MNNCKHKRIKLWEPHLAGARKCLDCGWVYNPNKTPPWFDEEGEKRLKQIALYYELKEKYEPKTPLKDFLVYQFIPVALGLILMSWFINSIS